MQDDVVMNVKTSMKWLVSQSEFETFGPVIKSKEATQLNVFSIMHHRTVYIGMNRALCSKLFTDFSYLIHGCSGNQGGWCLLRPVKSCPIRTDRSFWEAVFSHYAPNSSTPLQWKHDCHCFTDERQGEERRGEERWREEKGGRRRQERRNEEGCVLSHQ